MEHHDYFVKLAADRSRESLERHLSRERLRGSKRRGRAKAGGLLSFTLFKVEITIRVV